AVDGSENLLRKRRQESGLHVVRLVDVVRVLNVARRLQGELRRTERDVREVDCRGRTFVTRQTRLHGLEIAIAKRRGPFQQREGIEPDAAGDLRRVGVAQMRELEAVLLLRGVEDEARQRRQLMTNRQ